MNIEVCKIPKKLECIKTSKQPLFPGDTVGDIVVADFDTMYTNVNGVTRVMIKTEGNPPRYVNLNRFRFID